MLQRRIEAALKPIEAAAVPLSTTIHMQLARVRKQRWLSILSAILLSGLLFVGAWSFAETLGDVVVRFFDEILMIFK